MFVWLLQTSQIQLKLQNQWRKIRKAILFAKIDSLNFNPTEKQHSFNFIETQELQIWLIFAQKRADLEVSVQNLC